jgi:hypothetical protein
MSRLDVFTGMAFSNIVMFAIITATAATLGRTHHVTIDSPAQAAEALRPVGRPVRLGRVRARLHRLGHARDPGARRRRLGGDGRPDRQGSRLFELAARSTGVLRDCAPSERSAAWHSACSA